MPTRRIIGVDLGGTRLLIGEVDGELGVHHRTQRAVSGLDHASLLDVAADAIEDTRHAAGAEIAAVGFAVQGSDTARIAAVMAERLGLPAFADTAANAIALAEHRAGAADGAREAAVVTVDDAIRFAVILGGELQRSLSGSRHEDDPALGVSAQTIELAHDGDADAVEAIAHVGRAVGEIAAGLADAYGPQVVVVAGPLTAAGELLLGPARSSAGPVRVVATAFGVDAALVGAAALALDRVSRRGREAA
jgi:glucokinase